MYTVEYINCRVCGSDMPKFLGLRGSREYSGADRRNDATGHMVTNVVKCRLCGFVYTNPLIASKVDAYQDPFGYSASSSVGPERLFGFSLGMIERYRRKGRILDIGCGKGEFLSIANKRGWEAYGVEASTNFSEFASKRYGLNVSCASFGKTPYADDFFDAITLNMVLEHLDNPRDVLVEIGRILKKGGILFIEVPNMDALMLKAATLYFRMRGKDWSPLLSPLHYPFHCYGYSILSLKYLLNLEGFRIKKALVRDSGLRGFHSDSGGTVFEKFMRNIVTKLAGLCGRGDVLMVIAQKAA